jgi:acetate kinase
MGLTPSGGVIMGTRSGDLDPGVLFHLMRSEGLDAEALEQVVNHRSGLLGISGISRDMRELHKAEATNRDAALAIRMFCTSVRKQIAGMISVLDGIDELIFTGGIGEHDSAIRAEICAGLSWMGVVLDDSKNRAAAGVLNSPSSRCAIRVLASCEDEQIALHTAALVPTPDRPRVT